MSRKYRQRGYQDRDRDANREQTRESHTDRGQSHPGSEGPRGRGLGRPQGRIFRCHDCGHRQASEQITETSLCARCKAPLHACVHCAAFDPSARWECRAEIEAPIRSKTKANRCDLFTPRLVAELGEGRADDPRADDPRAAFDALFD